MPDRREDGEEAPDRALKAYGVLIVQHPGWSVLWLGEIFSNLGNWFSYVSTLLVVDKLGGGRDILLSVVLIMRFLPSIFLFPISGIFADRFNRVTILVVANLISSCSVALIPVVKTPNLLGLLYFLLFMEFSMTAFYDPARRALTPSLVPRHRLHLATTLDSFAWSLTGAVGSSLGGLAASKFGVQACFYIDAATYLFSAACAFRLKMMLRKEVAEPDVSFTEDHDGAHADTIVLPEEVAKGPELESPAADQKEPNGIDVTETKQPAVKGFFDRAETHAGGQNGTSQRASLDSSQGLQEPLLQGSHEDGEGVTPTANEAEQSSEQHKAQMANGCCSLVCNDLREELSAIKEGWTYAFTSANRDIVGLCLLKASGAIIWGADDVLKVNFSELPEMHSFGDSAFTLGLFFASVGFACIFGPLVFNYLTPPRPPYLLLSASFGYLFLMFGFFGIAMSHNVVTMCISIMVRSFGSSVLWVYSTLLIQLRVPDRLLGRVLAMEIAFFTISESSSGLFGGVALDDLGLSIRQVGFIMAGGGALMSLIWLPYAFYSFFRFKRSEQSRDAVSASA